MAEHDRWLIALGRAIRQLRVERNIGAGELAAAAGLTPRRIDALEAGRLDPPYDVLLALARGLGVKPAELVRHAENRAKDGDALSSMARTRIPADVGLFLRGALYVGLARVTADISDQCSLEDPGDVAGLLACFDRIRGLLDHIGWEKKPQQLHDLEVDDAHRQALVETLEEDRESWDWLSHQEATETVDGRKRAAARAERIKHFLARITPPELVGRTEAEAKDGDA